jgi:RNA polymerase sigma-70 factor (ECF subfamily)
MGEAGTHMGFTTDTARRGGERCGDGCLLQELIGGSESAFATLYDRYSASIFATAQRASRDRGLAADVVQETFLTLWNRAESFDPSRGSLIAWLSTIARNRTVDHLRAAGRRPAPAPFSAFKWADGSDGSATDWLEVAGEFVGAATAEPEPEAAVVSSETREAIAVALATLGPLERQVILLAYQEGLTQSEIAARLGWPIGTVKTRTRRAQRQLRDALDRPALLPDSSRAESGARGRRLARGAPRSRSVAS